MGIFIPEFEVNKNFEELELLLKGKTFLDISVLLIGEGEEKLLFETKTETNLRKFYLFEYHKRSIPIFCFESDYLNNSVNENLNVILRGFIAIIIYLSTRTKFVIHFMIWRGCIRNLEGRSIFLNIF